MSQDTLFPVDPQQDPAEFDVEDWLQDAHLPEESVTVYKRADIIGELSELKRQIEVEDRTRSVERSSADEALSELEQRYLAALETFSASALTVYVRALTDDEQREQRKLTEERTKDLAPQDANLEFGYDLLARAIIAVKTPGGERKPTRFTPAKVKALRKAIGDTQVGMIVTARQMAQNAMPKVDADFLLKRSGEATGDE